MLNERFSNIPMLCFHDLEVILEETVADVSDFMIGHERDLLSAEEVGKIVLANIKCHLGHAVSAIK